MNHSFQTSRSSFLFGVVFFGLMAGLGLQMAQAAPWTAPTATPPNGNTEAPITVSNIAQTKSGGLIVNAAGSSPIGLFVPLGTTLLGGNVGIGTNSPTGRLHVVSSPTAAGQATIEVRTNKPSTASNNPGIRVDADGTGFSAVSAINYAFRGADLWSTYVNWNTGDFGIQNTNDTGLPKPFLIKSNGNIRFGATESYAGFAGNDARLTVINPNIGPEIRLDNTAGSGRANVTAINFASMNVDRWAVFMNGNNNSFGIGTYLGGGLQHQMNILSNGNVGIGNMNPTRKLDVAGDINFTGSLYQNGTLFSGGGGGGGNSGWTASGNKVYLTNTGGTVGIGTTNPAFGLDVNGTINTNNLLVNGLINNVIKISGTGGGGNVGISRTNPTYKLDVNGTINGTQVRANGVVLTSDVRLKESIVPLEDSLEKILHLKGISFLWKDKSISADRQIGLIAQDVESVFPEIISTAKDGVKSVNYNALVAPLIEAVKSQQAMIDDQQKQIEGLRVRISELEEN